MGKYENFKLGNIKLLSGKILKSAELAYKTYGKLNKSGSNVIVLPTFYTGSHIRIGPYRDTDPSGKGYPPQSIHYDDFIVVSDKKTLDQYLK